MYEALDSFIKSHPWDEKSFSEALNKIVWREDFDADKMDEYMRQKLGQGPSLGLARAIYKMKAQTIRDFILHTGLSKTACKSPL